MFTSTDARTVGTTLVPAVGASHESVPGGDEGNDGHAFIAAVRGA